MKRIPRRKFTAEFKREAVKRVTDLRGGFKPQVQKGQRDAA